MIKSDIQIARSAKMKPIKEVLDKVNVPDNPKTFSPMGRHIAKLNLMQLLDLPYENPFDISIIKLRRMFRNIYNLKIFKKIE